MVLEGQFISSSQLQVIPGEGGQQDWSLLLYGWILCP